MESRRSPAGKHTWMPATAWASLRGSSMARHGLGHGRKEHFPHFDVCLKNLSIA